MGAANIANRILTKALIIKGRMDVADMMRNAQDARKANEKTLKHIIKRGAKSEYGQKYHFSEISSVEDYQRLVPFCRFSDLEDYVDRIYYNNEQNVLTCNKVIGFSTTSGSVGKPKHVPITNEQLGIYTKYTVTRMMALADRYWREKTGKGITHGHGIPMLDAFSGESPHGLPATNIVDLAARKYGALYPYILHLPLGGLFKLGTVDSDYVRARFGLENREALYIFSVFANSVDGYLSYVRENWRMVVDDIEKGVVNDSVYIDDQTRAKLSRVLRPNPRRAAELRKEFEQGFDESILRRIWPNMKFINMIGTSPSFEPYIKSIQRYSDDIPFDFSIYGASEGLCAAAYQCGSRGQMLLLDSCFYEFIEETDTLDNEEAGSSEEKVLLVDELEVGKNYEIIITNTSGLYRYRFGDVITVLDHVGTCPVITFAYRKGQLVNVTAEKTNLEQMVAAVEIFQQKAGLTVKNWAVTISHGGPGGYYILYFEGDGSEDFAAYSQAMDEALCTVNIRYAEFRGVGLISPAKIINQAPGTHEAWRQKKVDEGVSPSQVKVVNVLDTDQKKDFFTGRVI